MNGSVGLKDMVVAFIKKAGGPKEEVRPAAKKIDEGHTLLDNWLKRQNLNIDKLFTVVEKMRQELGWSKEKTYDVLTKGKKK